MKAAQHTSYNKNNIVLNLTDIAKPQIKPNQVLVKVTAAGVNPLDNMISRGDVKMIVPYKLPQTAGNEVVGLVEEVGSSVTNFAVGDRVFGRLPLDNIGAFAEYVAVEATALAKVPAYLTDVEAAAVPLTALTIMLLTSWVQKLARPSSSQAGQAVSAVWLFPLLKPRA